MFPVQDCRVGKTELNGPVSINGTVIPRIMSWQEVEAGSWKLVGACHYIAVPSCLGSR
jgi:hypothetical protein